MRKFSKKIAMMMVLAMLVSMFSGIVSASAASIWSAKSVDDDNYAVVMGETIEVKKGEFINFDLFKADEEATEAGYEYTWESSDEEVIFIGNLTGKNGYARVKGEVGDEATISATFTNLETGKSATRSFDVVVVEELTADAEYDIIPNFDVEEAFVVGEEYELDAVVTADGEEIEADIVFTIDDEEVEVFAPTEAAESVTIVAIATIDGEEYTAEWDCVVIDAAATEIVSAKQLDAKKIELTFDAAISQAEADKIELFLGDVAKSINKNKATAKDNKVVYESYIDFGNGKTWTFVYGDSKLDIKSSQGEVAKIVITGPQIVYMNKGGSAKIEYKCYDANDVEVAKPNNTYIEWKVSDNSAANAGNDTISFYAKDKEVTLTGIYHTYKYDETKNYEEITLPIAGFDVISRETDAPSIAGVSKFGVNAQYNSVTIPAGDYNQKLYVEFGYTDGKTFKTAEKVNEEAGKTVISYASTDETTLIVDPYSGKLIPIKEGQAVVLVLNGEDVIYKNTIIIGPAKAALDPIVDKTSQVVSNAVVLNRNVAFNFSGKDNYNGDVKWTVDSVSVITTPYNPDKADEKILADAVPGYLSYVDAEGNKLNKLTVNAVKDGVALKSGTYVFEVKLANTLTASKTAKIRVSVYVQDAATSPKVESYRLEVVGGPNFNTTITKDTKVADLTKNVEFKLYGYNKDGVAVEEVVSGAALNIKLNGEDFIKETDIVSIPLYVSGTAINGAYQSQKTGNFVVTGKYGDFTLPSVSFTISNTQAKPVVAVVNKTAEMTAQAVSGDAFKVALYGKLSECFKAPDNNNDVSYSAPAVIDAVYTVDGTSVKGTYGAFAKKVTITETYAASKITVKHDIDVNLNITLTLK